MNRMIWRGQPQSVLICLLSSILLLAAFIETPEARDTRLPSTKKHLLWSVQSGTNTLYLLGSLHILKKDSYPLPREIQDVYGCCGTVVFETDLDGLNEPSAQARTLQLGMFTDGRRLSDQVSSETLLKLSEKLQFSGMQLAHFESFKPWFAALTIAVVELQRLGFDPGLGIDRHFYQRAKKDGKNMVFLETNEFQLDLMASLSQGEQEMFLRETLGELDIIQTMATDMISAWKEGNSEKLHSIISKSFADYPLIYDRFFLDRNRKWLSRMEELLNESEDVLVVVGAGHLVGSGSLIDLLRKRSYKVMQR